MTERKRPKRPARPTPTIPKESKAATVVPEGPAQDAGVEIVATAAASGTEASGAQSARAEAAVPKADALGDDAGERATARPKAPRKRPPRAPAPPVTPEPGPADAQAGAATTLAAKASSAAVTVAPPSRSRARAEPQVVVHEGTVNGTGPQGASSPEDEIWTDGIGRGIEGAASRALRAAEKAISDPAARLVRGSTGDRVREAAAFGSSQSLLSTDYYFRQYGAHGMRSLAAEVDEFGFDPHVDAKARPLLEMLCRRYFRVTLTGAEHLPENGRALLVANRSGALPWDGLVLRTALRSALPELCPLRWLAEDSVIHYPFMGVMMNRLGAVRACPENAERLLAKDRLVAVFPEGAQGSRKLFRDRYRLQRFGRGGYVKLALKFGVPILPTAIIGAEETNPVLGRSRLLGRIVGADSVPITPTFPWLGLAGLLPAPVKWRIVVGEPIDLSKHGPESADDALVVHRLNEQIRGSLQALVDQGKSERGRVLFG